MGNKYGLLDDQLYFLIALREVEGGSEGNEFNIKAVQNTTYDTQTKCAIESILANEKRWQLYVREQSHMDFITYFACLGGELHTGWHNTKSKIDWIGKIHRTIQSIEKEYDNEPEDDSTVGKRDRLNTSTGKTKTQG